MERRANYAPANYYESIDQKKNYDSTSEIEWVFPLH